MSQRYVITGAPGTGKTAIINALKERGYSCVEENSREIIAEQIINGGEILPWKNQIAFENLNENFDEALNLFEIFCRKLFCS